MSVIIQQPDALSFSGNLKKFILSASSPILFSLKMGQSIILTSTYYPGINSLIEIDLREIVERLLSVNLPITGTSVTLQENGVADFTATIEMVPVVFRVIKAGVESLQELACNFVDDHFLTWQMQEKTTLQSQPEWLTLYATASRVVKATAYYFSFPSVGEVSSVIQSETVTMATLPQGSMQSVEVSWSAINQLITAQNHVAWDVWFEDDLGSRLSYIQRFRLRNATSQENLFIWVNTLGGIDSVSFNGFCEHDRKLEHILSELYDNTLQEYQTDKKAEIKQSTGYLTLLQSRWIEDLFYSKKRYKVLPDGSVKAIVIVSSKVVNSTEDDVFDFEFSYRYSLDSLLLNLDRTLDDLPAPEGLSAFFLNELLSGLSSALYQGNLNLAVQSPFQEGWQRISFNELWESALPTLVDNSTIRFTNGKLRTDIGAYIQGRKPKHGFENAADAALSFLDHSLLFTITALTESEKIPLWNMGQPLAKLTQTIAIHNTIGLWYIYYRDIEQPDKTFINTLTASLTSWDRNLDIPIAKVLWDGSQGILTDYRYVCAEVNHSPLVRFEDRPHPAEDIYVNTSKFVNLLTIAENTVQKVLDKLDYLLKVQEVTFVNQEEPSLENYQEEYFPRHGKNPHLRMVIYQDGNELPLYQAPIIYKQNGVITRIAWHLGQSQFTGKILISRL